MRIPRRAAVVLSAAALTGALAACSDDAETDTGTGTGGGGVEQPVAPEGTEGTEDDTEGELDDGIGTEPTG